MRTAATGLWREHGDAQDRERWREVLWSAGSEAYALREAARRTTRLLAKETGVSHAVRSVIDALPPLTATLPEAAAQTLDTALEASQVVTTSLPHGLAWPDFHRLAASRERDYAHSAWAPPDETERVSNPRQTGWWDADAPRRERLSRVNDLGTTGSEARVRACAVLLLDGSDATLDKPLGLVCPHLGPDALCTIYETRPQVCRDYAPDEVCARIDAPTLQGRVDNYLALFGLTAEAEVVKRSRLFSMRAARAG